MRSPRWSAEDVTVEVVDDVALAGRIAELAATTFPLACPAHVTSDDIAGFVRDHLGQSQFAGHLSDPDTEVVVARSHDGSLIGYALIHHRAPTHPDVAAVVTERPVTELSKLYVLPGHHGGSGAEPPSRLLVRTVIECARGRGSAVIWLGVNQENLRAQRFYAKVGFTRAGTKTFDLNGRIEHDYVLTRLPMSLGPAGCLPE